MRYQEADEDAWAGFTEGHLLKGLSPIDHNQLSQVENLLVHALGLNDAICFVDDVNNSLASRIEKTY